MARKLRLEYPGALYHVMSRGDRREDIFADDQDRQRFLDTLVETGQKTDWQVHSFCLMSNHFHIVLETPQPNLVAGMKWFLGTYTARFNTRHRLHGHLFGERYKALLIDSAHCGYLRTVAEYVHLNPVRAKLIPDEQPLRQYAWSSFPLYLQGPGRRPGWLRVDRVLGELGIQKDNPAGREEFERLMEDRRRTADPQGYAPIRGNWYLGDEDFRQELLARASLRLRPSHFGPERRDSRYLKAEQLIREELARRRWTEVSLTERRKGDPGKVEIALKLRAETVVSLKWIAERLHMGTVAYLTSRLFLKRRELANQTAAASKPSA